MPTQASPIGQAEIAQLARVSQSTVSRALKNDPRIRLDVRQRILDAAESLGYRPDVAVQTLAHRRWAKEGRQGLNIAYLAGKNSLTDRRKEMAPCAERNGLALSEFLVDERMDSRRLQGILQARGIRGAILDYVDERLLREVDFSEISVVQIGHRVAPTYFHCVGHDIYAITRDFLEGVIERGYRRIGCVFYKTGVRWDDDMRTAAVEGVRGRHPDAEIPPVLWIRPGHSFFDENVKIVGEFLRKRRIQGLIGFNGYVLAIIHSLQVSVPGQIALGLLHNAAVGAATPIFSEAPVANMAMHVLHTMLRENECGIPAQPMNISLRTHAFDWSGFPIRCRMAKR